MLLLKYGIKLCMDNKILATGPFFKMYVSSDLTEKSTFFFGGPDGP